MENSVPVVVLVSIQHGGVGIIRSLGRLGIPVYGVHQDPREPAAHSRFLRGMFCWDFSTASAVNSVAFLQDVAKKIGRRPILIATSDATAVFLAENANALAENYILSTPSAEVVRTFASKTETSNLCRKLHIPTAETISPQSREDVANFAHTKRFPIIVKGENGEFLQKGGRVRVAIVATEPELLEIYDRNAGVGRIILQEYIPGGDDAIWMFNGYFNDQSECLFRATGRKLRQFPAHRGRTCLGVCAANEAVQTQTIELMRAVGYCGPLDVGYRFDARDGQYKLLDVNPRIGTTFRLFVAENELDVVRALYLDLTKQTVPPAQVREGRKWIMESNDLVSGWDDLRERKLTLGGWLRSLVGVQECVWLVPDDLAPLAMLVRKQFHKQRTAPAKVTGQVTA
jgi:D-aspartate ligase